MSNHALLFSNIDVDTIVCLKRMFLYCLLPSLYLPKTLPAYFISLVGTAGPAHLVLLNLITLIISDEYDLPGCNAV
jgi:hypothetical protein